MRRSTGEGLVRPDATAMFDAYIKHRSLQAAVEDAIEEELCGGTTGKWEFRFDYYDASVEFKRADNNMKLTPQQQQWLWALGFHRTWVCHVDGSETYYSRESDPGGSRKINGVPVTP